METVDGGSATRVASNMCNFHLDIVTGRLLDYLNEELRRCLDGLGGFTGRMARFINVKAVILNCPIPILVEASSTNELDKMILVFSVAVICDKANLDHILLFIIQLNLVAHFHRRQAQPCTYPKSYLMVRPGQYFCCRG